MLLGDDEAMVRAGVRGVTGSSGVLKSEDPYELIGVRAVGGGAAFLSPKVARYVIEGLGGADGGGRLAREAKAHARVGALSPREREVLGLVGAGLSNPEIAARLHLVEGTVKAYVSAVLDRLGVRNSRTGGDRRLRGGPGGGLSSLSGAGGWRGAAPRGRRIAAPAPRAIARGASRRPASPR